MDRGAWPVKVQRMAKSHTAKQPSTHTHTHTYLHTGQDVVLGQQYTGITWELDRIQDLGPRPPPLKENLPSNQGPGLLLHSLRFEKPCTTPFHDSAFIYYKLFY